MRDGSRAILGLHEAKTPAKYMKAAKAAYDHIKQELTRRKIKFEPAGTDKGEIFIIADMSTEQIEDLLDSITRHMPHDQTTWTSVGDDFISIRDPDYDSQYR